MPKALETKLNEKMFLKSDYLYWICLIEIDS